MKSRILILTIILLGVWLRFHALAQDVRFHPDEALFTTFARAAAVNGDWMFPGPLDKPPLALYANALSQVMVGEGEFAARLPGTLASILLLPLMAALAKHLYRDQGSTPLYALILTAFSPYAIAFSATAFTDGLMLLLMVLAVWMLVRDRWSWSGFFLGCAFAAKPQAVLYLPLMVLLGWALARLSARSLLHFTLMLMLVLVALVLWDHMRGETSLFILAAINNDPSRLIRANEILPRLAAWLNHSQMLIGPAWLTFLLFINALIVLMVRIVHTPRHRNTFIDVLLLACLIGYGLLHGLVAFNTYDRYLLPVLPIVILWVARGLSINRRYVWLPQIALGLILLFNGMHISEGQTPINDEHKHYAGIDVLATYLNSKPVAAVIYDRWLGWELGYYMGQWTDKRRVYYPTPDLLVEGALTLCEIGPRYFPAPADQAIGPWLEALREAEFGVAKVYEIERFIVYEVIPPWANASNAESSSRDQWGSCGGVSQ